MLDRTASFAGGILLLAVAQLPHSRPAPKQPSDTPYEVATFCIPEVQARRPAITVSSGQELQTALDRATGGDTIVLSLGTTFKPPSGNGSFVLRNRPVGVGQWITIRSGSAGFDAGGALRAGIRVSASDAPHMAAIRAIITNSPAIRAEAGAHGYRLIGFDIGPDPSLRRMVNLLEFGTDSETNVDAQPADIIIDRSYVHGLDGTATRRGVALNGRRMAVIDSYFENFRDPDTDAQAIAGWNGPGPFKIINNFLEATGENVMFGGGDPAVPDLVPSNIEIRRNLMTKRLEWRDSRVAVKNLFELKNAQDVLVEGNVFENLWVAAQSGYAIVLTPRNGGTAPWSVVRRITFRNNLVRHSAGGVNILGHDSPNVSQQTNHITIQNNVFDDLTSATWGSGSRPFLIGAGADSIVVDHNTINTTDSAIVSFYGEPATAPTADTNMKYTNNMSAHNSYGVFGDGIGIGLPAVNAYMPDGVFQGNVLAGGKASNYPTGNFFPTVADWQAQFVDFAGGNYRLLRSSPYRNAGTDGKDLGVDVDALDAAQAGPTSAACGQIVPRPR